MTRHTLLALFTAHLLHGQFTSPSDLAIAFEQQVSRRLQISIADQSRYADLARSAIAPISREQFVLLVDASESVQAAMILWLAPDSSFLLIGAAPVSTGKAGRFEHFKTPPGLYRHIPDNPDFRAEGTRNENGIRGYGAKGMRVFDFGWQKAIRGWGRGGESTMRLQVHATDPDRLEGKLGTAQSKGCIRISAAFNQFLDHYGILDEIYEQQARDGKPSRVLLPDRQPTPWAGQYLLVVNTGLKTVW